MKKLKLTNSNRLFNMYTVENSCSTLIQVSLDEIIQDKEYEVFFALQEQIDEVMDIPMGCTLTFKPNRDNPLSKGMITRVR